MNKMLLNLSLIYLSAIISFSQKAPSVTLELVTGEDAPLINKTHVDCKNIKHGLEGGTVMYFNNKYHLFTAEMVDDPFAVKMKLGYWTSENGKEWKRISTLMESSGTQTGDDKKAAIWSPMPFFNEEENSWNLFYVGYKSKPDTDSAWYTNYEGIVFRAVSAIKGKQGFAGPYKDVEIVLEPGIQADTWEGLQGVDSYYIYKVKNDWYAFYGSAKAQVKPCTFWGVGLAKSKSVSGPWKRCSELNPINFQVNFAENPIVTLLDNGLYIALFDKGGDGIGYATSKDGINWSKCVTLYPEKIVSKWWKTMRTPLCLIKEKDGTYTILFTAFSEKEMGFGSLGKLGVKIVYNTR